MNLSEFLKILYSYCGNGDSPANFMILIFSKITDEQENDFFDKSNDELKRIFNGKKTIKKSSISYFLTHIDKDAFDSYLYNLLSDDSLMELCNKFEDYIGNSTKENISYKIADLFVGILQAQLSNNKTETKNTKFKNIYENIYEEINVLIRNIAQLSQEEITDILKYEAYNVDKKILHKNATLKNEIKTNVVDYYTYIEKLFAEVENSQLFNNFANQVKKRCDEYLSDGLPQQVVFDSMCEWLKERTKSTSQTACRILIAFFCAKL